MISAKRLLCNVNIRQGSLRSARTATERVEPKPESRQSLGHKVRGREDRYNRKEAVHFF